MSVIVNSISNRQLSLCVNVVNALFEELREAHPRCKAWVCVYVCASVLFSKRAPHMYVYAW